MHIALMSVMLLIVRKSCVVLYQYKCSLVHLRILFQEEEIKEMMCDAVIHDRANFVRLLLEHGVSRRDFPTVDKLLKFYEDEKVITLFLYSIAEVMGANQRLLNPNSSYIATYL